MANYTLCGLTPERASQTCGPYYYTILKNGTSWRAYTCKRTLEQFLALSGLVVSKPLPAQGTWFCQSLVGDFSEKMHMSYDEFYGLEAVEETKTLSNGEWTLGRVTAAADGARCEHTLNPNCRHRPVFPYQECSVAYK